MSTLLSLPLVSLEPKDDFAVEEEEDENSISFNNNFLGFFLILLFTYVLLTATGNILPVGPMWRVVQASLTIAFYCWRLYQVNQDYDALYKVD